MDPVTLSPQFQLEVPREIREELGFEPGQKFQVLSYGRRLEFIPISAATHRPSIQDMRGLLRGMNTDIEREDDRV